ncbi:hypothetical protein V6Z11_A11G313000 [Gossypium hirsutum]
MFGMDESGGDGENKRYEISLLAEELVQLSIKGSTVVLNEKSTLICTIWTGKFYNPENLRAQIKKEDLELIMEGRPWLFRKSLILFDRLTQPIEQSQIWLNSSPFWIKIRVLRSEINGELCRLRINLNVQNPLRGGIFVSINNISKSWISFKYEKLPMFCFGCGRMRHSLTDCKVLAIEDKIIGEVNSMNRMLQGIIQSNGVEKIMEKQEEVSTFPEDEQMTESNMMFNYLWDRQLPRGKLTGRNKKHKLECSWFGSPRTVRRLRYFLKQQKPHTVFLMETKIDKQRMEKVRSCGFLNGIDVEAEGSRGGLCLAWTGDITVTSRSFSKNHIDAMVKEENVNEEWRFTGFYGSLYVNSKNASWNLLQKLGQDQRHPWLVSEDFNEIMYSFKKNGGLPRDERRIEAFREILEEYQLEDLGYIGVWFT